MEGVNDEFWRRRVVPPDILESRTYLLQVAGGRSVYLERVGCHHLLDISSVDRDLSVSYFGSPVNIMGSIESPKTNLCPPHDLDFLSNPDDQNELLPERVLIVVVLDLDVGERSPLGLKGRY